MQLLADALVPNTKTRSVSLESCQLTDEQVCVLAEGLKQNSHLVSLNLNANVEIGNAAAKAIADALRQHPKLSTLHLDANQIGDEGAQSLADAIRSNRCLTILNLDSTQITAKGSEALRDAVIQTRHPNIMAVWLDNPPEGLKEYCDRNKMKAQSLFGKVTKFHAQPPETWYQFLNREHAMEAVATTNITPALHDFKAFAKTLPVAGSNPTAHSLQEKQGDYAPIDNPYTWLQFPEILARMHQNGNRLQAGGLLDEEGKPNALLERAISCESTHALFTEENWRGASKQELKTVLNALPDAVREQIPNRHQLLATLPAAQQKMQR